MRVIFRASEQNMRDIYYKSHEFELLGSYFLLIMACLRETLSKINSVGAATEGFVEILLPSIVQSH